MNSTDTKRVEWIDSIKGLTIFSVVLTHTFTLKPIPTDLVYFLVKCLYPFNLAPFILVSGYLYKSNSNNTISYLKKQFCHLLVPYFSFLFLFLPLVISVDPQYSSFFVYDSIWLNILRYFSGRSISNMITGPFWFLPVLFFTQIIYNFLSSHLKLKIVHILVVISYICSFIIFYCYRGLWLPLFFNLVFAALPLFHLGYLIKVYKIKIPTYVIIIGIVIYLLCEYYFTNNIINFADNFYGVPIITLLCILIAFFSFKEILIYFERKIPIITHVLAKIGSASLIIMAFHSIFILILHKIMPNPLLLACVCCSLSYVMYILINKYCLTRALLIGNKADILKLKSLIFIKKNRYET